MDIMSKPINKKLSNDKLVKQLLIMILAIKFKEFGR